MDGEKTPVLWPKMCIGCGETDLSKLQLHRTKLSTILDYVSTEYMSMSKTAKVEGDIYLCIPCYREALLYEKPILEDFKESLVIRGIIVVSLFLLTFIAPPSDLKLLLFIVFAITLLYSSSLFSKYVHTKRPGPLRDDPTRLYVSMISTKPLAPSMDNIVIARPLATSTMFVFRNWEFKNVFQSLNPHLIAEFDSTREPWVYLNNMLFPWFCVLIFASLVVLGALAALP
ncbi:MAG: hypothetical protein ACFFD6_01060 [Candidatus Thorarchaeota archaeon]